MVIKSRLPAVSDHAFADGEPFELRERPERLFDRLLGWLATGFEGVGQRRLERAVSHQFATGAVCGERLRLAGGARLVNRNHQANVRIGRDCVIRGILRNEGKGRIEIGDEVYVGDDTLISASQEVVVGDHTLLAHRVQVFDNASHPRDADERSEHFRMMLGLAPKRAVSISASPVRIGRQCWICTGAIILPGSTIGDRTIVSAGSIVRGHVPPDVVYGTTGAPTQAAEDSEPGSESSRPR